jgi:hypothetical protein
MAAQVIDMHGGARGRKREEKARSRKILAAHESDAMSADDAAWALIADAAERALGLPGLSRDCSIDLQTAWAACRRAAGLPPRLATAPTTP